MKHIYAKFLFLVTVLGCGWSVQASLIGTNVTVEYYYTSLNPLDPIAANRPAAFLGPDTFAVNNDKELICNLGISTSPSPICAANFAGQSFEFIDIGANTIEIDWNVQGAFFSQAFNGVVFSNLAESFTGVSATCMNNNGVACQFELSFGLGDSLLGNYVAADFGSCTPLTGGGGHQCNPTNVLITLEGITSVPAPAGLVLFLSGLFALVFSRPRPGIASR